MLCLKSHAPSTPGLETELQSARGCSREIISLNRFDTSCNGFTLAWQANGLALMVLPIKPQSFVAAQTHFSLSLYGLQQTTHVTFVWVIYCLGKGSMKRLFRAKHRNSSAGRVRIMGFRNISTKLSLIKWKYPEGRNYPLASNQQNSSEQFFTGPASHRPSVSKQTTFRFIHYSSCSHQQCLQTHSLSTGLIKTPATRTLAHPPQLLLIVIISSSL